MNLIPHACRSFVSGVTAVVVAGALVAIPTAELRAQDEAPEPASEAAADERKDDDESSGNAASGAEKVDPQIAILLQQATKLPQGIMDVDAEWLNTANPVDLKELRGKIVLLDFWTYCCINCIHVLPDLKLLEKKYEKELVVIGVHSAKFSNEKLTKNIREAILRYEIKHPVVNDNEMEIWRRFRVRGWPTLALIDPDGKYVGQKSGEGNLELFDRLIGEIAKYHRARGTLDETPIVFDLEESRAAKTPLRFPGKVLADETSGRLFISDSNHNRIVVTGLDGTLQHVIGSGQIGFRDGGFADAQFDHPQGMALAGNTLYVADTENHAIRTVNLDDKTVATLSGTGIQGHPPDAGGNLASAELNSPWDLLHVDGVLYIAMAGPHQIWAHRIGSDTIGVYAGNAREDVVNGPLDESSFAQPSGLAADAAGEFFYVADSEGSSIRKVPTDADGKVETIAGTSELPRGQSLFAFGDVDGVGEDARFQHPLGVAWHDESVYVADAYNHKIRRIDLKTNAVETWLGGDTSGESDAPVLSEPAGLSVAGDTLYIADTNHHRILAANLKTKQVREISLTGLTAPEPRKTRRIPDFATAIDVPKQSIKTGDTMTVRVDLNVPKGFKLNQLAPLTREVFQIEGEPILSPDALKGPATATVEDGAAVFEIPLTGAAGQADVAVTMSYGFCDSESESICRLASAMWRFSLVVSDDATTVKCELKFPGEKSVSVGSDSDEQ